MIRAKKSLGQNFLTDAQVSRRIVSSVSPQPSDLIIEIGPGTGALTRLLVESSGYVVAVEIDARLIEELQRKITADSLSNLSIIEADALKVDWAGLITAAGKSWQKINACEDQPRTRVVANLPYYISTPIIERLIALRRSIFDMTLMLQNEVVERIASAPGSRDYGYLSVLVQYYAVATKLFEVPPAAFSPAPKVQSAIIRLTVRETPAVNVRDEAKFFALVRASFAQRRKTVFNNLKAAARSLEFADDFDKALRAAGIDSQRRAETLTIVEFSALYHSLFHE